MRAEDIGIPVEVTVDRWVMPFIRFARFLHLPYTPAHWIAMLGLHARVVRRDESARAPHPLF